MHRLAKRSAIVILMGLVAIPMGATLSFGKGANSALLPPNANFRGHTLDEWSVLTVERFVGNELGTGSGIPDTVKKMRLLPLAGVPDDYEFLINIPQGTGLVLPAMFIFGELYEDGSTDDPDFVFPDEPWAVDPNLGSLAGMNLLDYLYVTTQTEVKLNGTVIISGVASDLGDRHFGPTYFDSPIVYTETLPNGAVAALWTFGVGAVYGPLPKGTHVVELTTVFDNIFFGHVVFHYVYTIVVGK